MKCKNTDTIKSIHIKNWATQLDKSINYGYVKGYKMSRTSLNLEDKTKVDALKIEYWTSRFIPNCLIIDESKANTAGKKNIDKINEVNGAVIQTEEGASILSTIAITAFHASIAGIGGAIVLDISNTMLNADNIIAGSTTYIAGSGVVAGSAAVGVSSIFFVGNAAVGGACAFNYFGASMIKDIFSDWHELYFNKKGYYIGKTLKEAEKNYLSLPEELLKNVIFEGDVLNYEDLKLMGINGYDS